MAAVYVPILRAKQGEVDALGHLSPTARGLTRPLLDVPRVEADTPSELKLRIADTTRKIAESWGTALPFYFDLSRYPPTAVIDTGESVLDYLFLCARQHRLKAIPTAGPISDRGPEPTYLHSIADIAGRDKRGAAIRLHYHTFSHVETLVEVVNHLLRSLSLPADQVDLVLDAESLMLLPADRSDTTSMVDVLLEAISAIQKLRFRNIVVAASSFPEKSSRTVGGEPLRFSRSEVLIWKELSSSRRLPLTLFGDYGIVFPQETDPQGVVIPPGKIRLSTADSYLLFKSRPEQYRELCIDATNCPELKIQSPSWGLREIQDCAAGGGGTGNATTWVARDTNAHIETTAKFVEGNLISAGRHQGALPTSTHPWLQDALFPS